MPKTLQCSVCNRIFYRNRDLNRHVLTHTGEHRYKCQVCGKGCIDKHSLTVHERVHTNEFPYLCPVCKRGFKQVGGLNRHMQYHDNKNSYKFHCKVCGMGFLTQTQATLHMQTVHPPIPPATSSQTHQEAVGEVTATTHVFAVGSTTTTISQIASPFGGADVVTVNSAISPITTLTVTTVTQSSGLVTSDCNLCSSTVLTVGGYDYFPDDTFDDIPDQ